MENEKDDIIESENDEEEQDLDSEEDAPAKEPKADKPKETPEQKLARLKGMTARLETKLGIKQPEAKPEPKSKTDELDETQLDYLDLKGISDEDEIEIIQKVVAKTGQTVRQALKDDYVQSKLESIRKEKAVKNATPSGTKRGGGQVDDLASATAKFEQTGELPDDFDLRSKIIDAKIARENPNKPRWHK